jgi:dephospho-CoA kinase
MGKSTVSAMFRELGVDVMDADAVRVDLGGRRSSVSRARATTREKTRD